MSIAFPYPNPPRGRLEGMQPACASCFGTLKKIGWRRRLPDLPFRRIMVWMYSPNRRVLRSSCIIDTIDPGSKYWTNVWMGSGFFRVEYVRILKVRRSGTTPKKGGEFVRGHDKPNLMEHGSFPGDILGGSSQLVNG